MKRIPKILFLLFVLMACSCKQFSNPFTERNTILAEAGGQKLFLHDVSAVFTAEMTPEDSLKMLNSYVDQWVKKQLKIEEAEQLFESSQQDIDRMVQEYRNSLMTHKVDQYYVDKNIDTLFTSEQITSYYRENQADFILDKTILKARIVRVPINYDKKKMFGELLREPKADSYQDLVDLCVKNGFELTELNQWTDVATLFSQLPVDVRQNNDDLLQVGKINTVENEDFIYYVRVLALCQAGEYIPLESVQDVIKRVIFNKRKQEIIRNIEDSLYRNALLNKDVVVHVSKQEN